MTRWTIMFFLVVVITAIYAFTDLVVVGKAARIARIVFYWSLIMFFLNAKESMHRWPMTLLFLAIIAAVFTYVDIGTAAPMRGKVVLATGLFFAVISLFVRRRSGYEPDAF